MSNDLETHVRLNQASEALAFQSQYIAGMQAANSSLLQMMINSGAVPKEIAEETLRAALEMLEASPQTTDATTYPVKLLLKSLDPSVELPKSPLSKS